MTRLTRSDFARKLAAFACSALAASAFAHSKLQESTPKDGATVDPAPATLRFVFNEPVEANFTTVRLTGPGATEVATPKAGLDPNDAKTVVVPLPPLPAGVYRAHWVTMGHDGHRVSGDMGFSVK